MVLVIAGVALSIAAVVVTAGAAIGGISSLVALGKNLVDNADLEKRLLANVKSSLGKYVTELRNLMKIRGDTIRRLQADLQKNKVLATSYAADLAAMTKLPAIDAAEVAKRTRVVDSITRQIADLEKQITKLEADNKEGKALLDELDGLGADIEKISTQAPNSLLGNLKKCVTTLDGLTNIGNSIGGLLGAASGV